jgi:cell division protein FtsA
MKLPKSIKIAAIDIGTSKVVTIIAEKNPSGEIIINGIGHQLCEGIRAGNVVDIKKAEKSIIASVNAAEKMAGETIETAFINISGCNIRSQYVSFETKIYGHEVTEKDLDLILKKALENFEDSDSNLLHSIPLGYTVDDNIGIKDPRGMFGNLLTTKLHVVDCSSTSIRNFENCLAKCHINVEDFVVSSLASATSCLRAEEKELGVTLIDIGAGNTNIAIFAEGYPLYLDSVPLGGLNITKDIALGLSVSIPMAERLKVLHGNVISTISDESDSIDISSEDEGDGEDAIKTISKTQISNIIRPRVEEILELTKARIEKSSYYNYSGTKIVLTGGSSQLNGIREICDNIFHKNTRVAKPFDIPSMPDSAKGPSFSTIIGMLKYGFDKYGEQSLLRIRNPLDSVSKKSSNPLIKWFKENF